MPSKSKVKSLDTVFSKFIRLRDSAEYNHELFRCCSCGQIKPYEQADAGHFVNRRWMLLRWDERNVNAQCRSCNRFDEGNGIGYLRFMTRKYGEDTVDLLQSLKVPYRWTDGVIDLLIKDYRKKIKEYGAR